MRIREWEVQGNPLYMHTDYDAAHEARGYVDYDALVPFSELDSRSMSDVVVDNYEERIALGEIINNPCTFNRVIRERTGFGHLVGTSPSDSSTYTQTGAICSYYWGSDPIPHQGVTHDVVPLIVEAKANAIAEIDAPLHGFGEDLAEIRETLKFLKNPIEGLLRVQKSHRRSARKRVAKYGISMSQALSDTYLGYRFAYSPLAKSASDLVDAQFTKEKALRYPERLSARGFASEDSEASANPVVNGATFLSETQRTTKVKASILYTVINPVKGWRRNYGLRWTDVPETIWAVMPYSFMVDRMVDISRAIRGLTNLTNPSVQVLAASTTVRDEVSSTLELLSRSAYYSISIASSDTLRSTNFSYSRAIWHPSVLDTVGSFRISGLVDSATNIADLTALIVQRFKA